MWTPAKCLVIFFLISSLENPADSQYEGDQCYHKSKGVNGICKVLDQCPGAIKDLQAHVFPQNCGFAGTAVIVCCPQFSSTTTTTTTTTTSTSTTTQRTTTYGSLPVGEKSRRACKSYEDISYIIQKSPTLFGDEDEKVEDCPWEVQAISVIINGIKCEKGEFPHMALIGYGTPGNYAWKCGGSLISERFVLTAAHCSYARGFGKPKFVLLGDLNYTNPRDNEDVQQINILKVIKHPGYKAPVQYNDVALLELETPARLSKYVKPGCLYLGNSIEDKGIITGWGNTEHGSPSDHLLKGAVKYFTPEDCNLTFGNDRRTLPRGIDPELQICYGSPDNTTDTCQGDSGGPIQIYSQEIYCTYYIYGVTSFGKGCGNKGIPAGYVNLRPYIEWIENIVWP